jgi:hypothetical protein
MAESNQASQSKVDLLALGEWRVGLLRLTAFSDPRTGGDCSSWWLEVIGEGADTEVAEPKIGKRKWASSLEGGELALAVQPGRIDWLFGVAEQDGETNGIATVGALPGTLDVFCDITSRWFRAEGYPSVWRLAFGAVLLHPVDDREAGYRQLAPYLACVELDPVSSSDFLYRINRPRDARCAIVDLRINRLSKWSVLRGGTTTFVLAPPTPVFVPGQAHFACRLELDINTVPSDRHGFNGGQSSRIFSELVDLAREIASMGDIP